MQTVSTIALCLSLLGAPQDPTLVFVTSSHCPHCDVMKPILDRMAQQGYRIQTVHGDQDIATVRQLGVNGYPTFLLMQNGQEAGRLVGSKSYEAMVAFAEPAKMGANSTQPRQFDHPETAPFGAVPVPDSPPAYPPPAPREIPDPGFAAPLPAPNVGGGMQAAPSQAASDPVARALGATVRIKIEESGSVSYGTGVVVDVHRSGNGAEALILTCGHLFRDSKGKAALTVDFPTRQDNRPVPGKLLEYVADDADVGAIYVMLPFEVTPVPVAPDQYRSTVGHSVFSVGCDQGGDARVMQSKVTSIDRYVGPPNIQASGAPTLGRSGGGLFDAEGRLIGICNAMDAEDDEGIYAALPLIHWQLAQLGQERLYKNQALAGTMVQPLLNAVPGQSPGIRGVGMGVGDAGPLNTLEYNQPIAPPAQPNLQATVTVRDLNRPNDPGRTFVVENPAPALLQALQQQNAMRPGGSPSGIAPR
ncbi:MAG TPA: trypsin-like peptidase domain-containing protein [Pirellulaceae bacterium]|nr:trypsin-like peptidase domain-containing protein [Pirellulaceae bacterium]